MSVARQKSSIMYEGLMVYWKSPFCMGFSSVSERASADPTYYSPPPIFLYRLYGRQMTVGFVKMSLRYLPICWSSILEVWKRDRSRLGYLSEISSNGKFHCFQIFGKKNADQWKLFQIIIPSSIVDYFYDIWSR